MVVAFSKFFHRAIFESALVIENELFPVFPGKRGKRDFCYDGLLFQKKHGNRRLKPNVPSSLDILSNRRPAKLSLYDPLRYGVLSSDDRYLICDGIIPSKTQFFKNLYTIRNAFANVDSAYVPCIIHKRPPGLQVERIRGVGCVFGAAVSDQFVRVLADVR